MDKINIELIERYRNETSERAIYTKNGATYHTLKYVNWLESKLTPSPVQDKPSLVGELETVSNFIYGSAPLDVHRAYEKLRRSLFGNFT
jgi:hypothetical protein